MLMSFNDDVRKQFDHDLAELKKMRDEIRVKLHLAGMEVKERWKQLEPKLEEIERRVEAGSEEILGATTRMFEEVGRAFREIGERFIRKPGQDDEPGQDAAPSDQDEKK
jgi:chromosome segregation ATPase